MQNAQEMQQLRGTYGTVAYRSWPSTTPGFVALLAHGYGEHSGRYGHLASTLTSAGAAVYAPDHHGHGQSDGTPAEITDVDGIVADLHSIADIARGEHPDLPVMLLGHSMGGLIATRYAQTHPGELAALVLSGPLVGQNPAFSMLLSMDEIPEIPIDPSVLSRDPEVGAAYQADPLVFHGPFARVTLETFTAAVETVSSSGTLGDQPTLWLHGGDDQLVPLEPTTEAMRSLRGPSFEEKVYPGARHEILNETNRSEVESDILDFLGRAGLPLTRD
ncbi:alpha/beta hydrolase [Rhodococcus sp. SORGH_AS_0301]|uniref:alpha/beta hydrolase n=1 Tax=Rhodococcus sp. SORGH_AS_0301 TaxID=3041780 RepID=UPI002781C059|nr:alpha/beta hydrolase [Rhodococcus sp. SORGH_AS_0301]MDQ1181059.1 alpha-beta hydrolase superfamily lysophospholipase [Rhodococcus sp. SORGH_AS_0301]